MRLTVLHYPFERRSLLLLLLALLILSGVVIHRLQAGETPLPSPLTANPSASSGSDEVARLQDILRRDPENIEAYARLGLALLQRARETADPTLYTRAEAAFNEALKREPQQVDALIGHGILALARHDFAGALQWAERARRINPYRVQILGIMVDAQVELGRYEEAASTAQAMVNMRPDITSYSRISYVRELIGDTVGAITAMQWAVAAGTPNAEGTLWAQVQLGNLYFNSGDLRQAETTFRQALHIRPDYVYALAGLANVQAARGDLEDAIGSYESLVHRLPLPQFAIALGDLYTAAGQLEKAKRQYELVRVMQELNSAAGMNVDLEMALFDADHGTDPAQALGRARAAYAHRPGIYGADVLAWTLYQNEQFADASRYSREALRLGTQDALLYYHAGMIEAALGDSAEARVMLAKALAINPHFNLVQAPIARERLARLESALNP